MSEETAEEINAAWERGEKGVVTNYGAARAAVEAIIERAEKCPRGNFVSYPIAVGLTDDEVDALRFALVHGLATASAPSERRLDDALAAYDRALSTTPEEPE